MTLVFHPLAERELVAATNFYETRSSGLGADFIRQIEATLANILAHPELGSLFAGNKIRRRLVERFPYGVVYELEDDDVLVLAIMHLRRRPGYWKRRLRRFQSHR